MRAPAHLGWALLAGLSVLMGCSDAFDSAEERELAAQARWDDAGLLDYQVEVRLSCFCQAALPIFTRLHVRAGQVVATEPVAASPGSEEIPLEAWPTVPEVFELIESASHQSIYTEIEAQYDPTLGYPTSVELRCKAEVLDCGATYDLQNLAPLCCGPVAPASSTVSARTLVLLGSSIHAAGQPRAPERR
jgi:hypothetical protein